MPGYDEISEELLHSARAIIEADLESEAEESILSQMFPARKCCR